MMDVISLSAHICGHASRSDTAVILLALCVFFKSDSARKGVLHRSLRVAAGSQAQPIHPSLGMLAFS